MPPLSELSYPRSSSVAVVDCRPRVMIVDDDSSMRNLLKTILCDDYEIYIAFGKQSALEILAQYNIDIVLLDIRLGQDNGIEILQQIKTEFERTEVIMITVIKDIRTAVEAIKFGAYDYINKDFESDEVKMLIRKALQKQKLAHEVQYLRSEIKELTDSKKMVIGHSPLMKEIEQIIKRVAKTPSNILLLGESGTGKELVARSIHEQGFDSSQSRTPFVSVNIASIPSELIESILFGHERGSFTGAHKTHKGKFETAHGGTLFLDEISELRLDLQTKLLRALQEKEIERVGGSAPIPINVRIIAATNKNLQDCVRNGTFREDLYYRLNVIPITTPPLRERLEDLPELVALFFSRYTKKLNKKVTSYTPQVMESLHAYSWPGNIRELENIIERMVALCETDALTIDDVPLEVRFSGKVSSNLNPTGYEELLKEATDAFEKRFILSALNRHSWNQLKTAGELGIHRKTLEYKIKKLNLYGIIEEKKRPKSRDGNGEILV